MIPESPLETLRENVAAHIRRLAGLSEIPVLTRKTGDFLSRIDELAAETGLIVLVHLISARELQWQSAGTSYEARILIQIVENPSLWQVRADRPGSWSVAALIESWLKLAKIQIGEQQVLFQQVQELQEQATGNGLFIVEGSYSCRINGHPRTTT